MPELDAEHRDQMAAVLADEGWCYDPYGHEDGPPAHGECSECDRLRLSTADAPAPLVAEWLADAWEQGMETGVRLAERGYASPNPYIDKPSKDGEDE